MFSGHAERTCRMPSGSIEQQNGVCALGDVARYLVEVKLHGECVGDG